MFLHYVLYKWIIQLCLMRWNPVTHDVEQESPTIDILECVTCSMIEGNGVDGVTDQSGTTL